MKTALLVIDVQTGFIEGQFMVHQAETMLKHIQDLIERAENASIPVIYVQHSSDLEYDGPIHPAIAPTNGEPLVHKYTPDSFHETDLQERLTALGIERLIVAGFQTEMCIDTTCRRAFSLGYDVWLVQDAHSTVTFEDAPLAAPAIIAHHSYVLQNFATVKPAAEIDFAAL